MNVDRRLLHGALSHLVHVASGKASLPILSHVLLEVFDDTLTVTATDLTTTVDCEMPAEGPLSCCLPAKMLTALTKPEGRGDAGTVQIEMDGNVASVAVEGLSTRLPTMPVEEFPAVPGDSVTDWRLLAMWPAARIREALAFVLPAASTDEGRPHLSCVCVGPDRVAATDGHRLHVVPLPIVLPEELLLPLGTAQVLRRLLTDDAHVIIAKSGDIVRVRIGAWQIDTRLVDARFPPVDKVIPTKDRAVHVSMETALLRKALERVSRLTRDGNLRVTVNGAVTLTTSDPDLGDAQVVVPVLESDHVGADLVTGFKLGYLRDAVTTKLETIQLGLEGPTDALRIDADDQLAVVMPMRL
ncbi:MAG: DNA polymerase III subunit beta [Acidobacteriota bacterium]